MRITSDWHIHSRNSCDGVALVVKDLISEAEEAGILDFGITDHLHTPYNLPDIVRSRAEFLANNPSPHFHFGVEVSCVSRWEIEEIAKGHCEKPDYGLRSGGKPDCDLAIGISSEDITVCGIEYVVGGTHWPMYVPMERESVIRDYHRQNMFLACHPLVNIIAHPWWWDGHWQDVNGNYRAEPWFDDFHAIPRSMHDEFAAAVVQHDKVVEINIEANLLNPCYPKRFVQQYLEFLAELQVQGVRLCVGSDCHSAHYRVDFHSVGKMLEQVGIKDNLWCLPPRTDKQEIITL